MKKNPTTRPTRWQRAKPLLAAWLATTAINAVAQATPRLLGEGDALPAWNLKDQHDKPASVPADTVQILFAADNDASKLITAYLDAKGGNWLKETRRVYVADIHKMPGLITRMLALPKLRDKPYPIALGREEGDLATWPRQKACVTLFPVAAGKLGKPAYACNEAEVQAALK